jgi:two-component system cell cycle response regulator CpdR
MGFRADRALDSEKAQAKRSGLEMPQALRLVYDLFGLWNDIPPKKPTDCRAHEDPARRRRQRHAPLPRAGAAERRLRRDLLRQWLSAYNRLREEPFELLLTDIVMPEMDGIELARKATELDPDIKVMFITGFAAVALNPDSKAPKDAKVLSKPFHLRDLVNEVEKLIAA